MLIISHVQIFLGYILICCLQISLVFRFLLTLVSSIPQTNQQAHVALIPIVFKQRLSNINEFANRGNNEDDRQDEQSGSMDISPNVGTETFSYLNDETKA